MTSRRGTVWIAPVWMEVPEGRMIDPDAGWFWVSWQAWDEEAERGELLEDGGKIKGAAAAVEWARARADRVLIRLAHADDSYYTAGSIPETIRDDDEQSGRPLPQWPPNRPAEGWWVPPDD
jgi:hypothetical protein